MAWDASRLGRNSRFSVRCALACQAGTLKVTYPNEEIDTNGTDQRRVDPSDATGRPERQARRLPDVVGDQLPND